MTSTDVVPIGDNRSLVTWAQEADAAYLLAERMVGTSFCPAQFKGKPIEAAAAVLAGAEVGLSPLAALRSFDIIQGVAAPRALTLRAIAQAMGCQFQTVEEDDRRVVMRARRPGGEWETVTWTIGRAQQLGLTGKDNWKKQPQAMLVARATAELARRVAADRILGLGYAAEEQEYDEPATAKRTVQRKAMPEAPALTAVPEPEAQQAPGRRGGLRRVADVDLPPLPDEDRVGPSEPEESPAPSQPAAAPGDRPGYATKAQLRMLHAVENTAGISEREDRLALYSQFAGRRIESSNDLTRIDCTRIIDHLNAIADDPVDPEPPDDGGLFPDEPS